MDVQTLENHGDMRKISLNDVELQCLSMAAEGLDIGHIARIAGVTVVEVNVTLDLAAQKLGARNRLHAVSLAILRGLIGEGH